MRPSMILAPAVLAQSHLFEEDRPRRIEPDAYGNQEKQRREEYQECGRKHNVNETLDRQVEAFVARVNRRQPAFKSYYG